MNKEINSKVQQNKEAVWEYIYSSHLRKIKYMSNERIDNWFREKLNSPKTSVIDLSFIFRFSSSLIDSKTNEILTKNGFDILKNSKSQRLKCSVLYFLLNNPLNEDISKQLSITSRDIIADCKNSFYLQSQAIELLSKIDVENFLHLTERISLNDDANLIFVKRKFISSLIGKLKERELLNLLLENFFNQKTPFIQQAIAENLNALLQTPSDILKWFKKISDKSEVPVVCSAIKNILGEGSKVVEDELLFEILQLLKHDSKELQLFTIKHLTQYIIQLKQLSQNKFEKTLKLVAPEFNKLAEESKYDSVCSLAKISLERLWLETNDLALDLYSKIQQLLKGRKRAEKIKIPADLIKYCDEEILGRILSVISQENYSIQLLKGSFGKIALVKDAFFKFRLWRIIYELRISSTTKRQSLRNTIGRHFTGRIRSASSIMSEQSQTAVPGEPVYNEKIPSSLPLIDDFISASEYSGVYKIFSPEGITIIKPPENIFRKLAAELNITLNFKKFSDKRNIADSSYLEKFRKLGYEINIFPYKADSYFTPSVSKLSKKFFGFPIAIPAVLIKTFAEVKEYFISIYSNTINELSCFLLGLISYFVIRYFTVNSLFRHYRKSFALCVGGWGTRGKSSLERLKTALFISLGLNVFGKTTGSEAVFTYSNREGETFSIPIFRPYGKTTIWEQLKFMRLASKMKAEVFLWECMAISPRYVKIMQRSWMRDDIATITNTYPDHEDHQGPAGWNVAETMTNFIPENAALITAENQMYPFLRDECERKNTSFKRLKDYDYLLLTSDVLSLLPYKEHPSNIALALRLAGELGIDKDVALKGIIDNIQPDIGVLREYPPIEVDGKKIVFISGMSANEKAACLYNWKAMKMDEQQKDIVRAVLINNRADRPARSKVFAELLVNDLNADIYFLAGGGINSFLSSIRKLSPNNKNLLNKFNIIKNPDIHPLDFFKMVATKIPEGMSMKIMGIQNIKGIGINICRYLENPNTDFKIKKNPTLFFSILSGFFDPLRMIFKKRKIDAIYKGIAKKKLSPEYAIKVLKDLSE